MAVSGYGFTLDGKAEKWVFLAIAGILVYAVWKASRIGGAVIDAVSDPNNPVNKGVEKVFKDVTGSNQSPGATLADYLNAGIPDNAIPQRPVAVPSGAFWDGSNWRDGYKTDSRVWTRDGNQIQ